jgi:predicted AAA+ superfamily ATPase
LRKAMHDFDMRSGLVITWDEEKVIKEEQGEIRFIPLWKWLVQKDAIF